MNMFELYSKRAFSDVLEGVTLEFFSLAQLGCLLPPSSTNISCNLQNFACNCQSISV